MAREIGLHEARTLPSEVRRWWIGEMQRERADQAEEVEELRGGRKRAVDVPRGRR